jgi:hypothetical protein
MPRSKHTYGRKFIVVDKPVAVRRGRLFEIAVNEAVDRGYTVVGVPKFYQSKGVVHGVVSLTNPKPPNVAKRDSVQRRERNHRREARGKV